MNTRAYSSSPSKAKMVSILNLSISCSSHSFGVHHESFWLKHFRIIVNIRVFVHSSHTTDKNSTFWDKVVIYYDIFRSHMRKAKIQYQTELHDFLLYTNGIWKLVTILVKVRHTTK